MPSRKMSQRKHGHGQGRQKKGEPGANLRVTRSLWWTPYSRIKRALRIEKRLAKLRDTLNQ